MKRLILWAVVALIVVALLLFVGWLVFAAGRGVIV